MAGLPGYRICRHSFVVVACVASFSRGMTTAVVNSQWLVKNFYNVRLIDAAFTMKPAPDPDAFRAKYFGNFDLLVNDFRNEEFEKEHIAGATHFNPDVAYFPTKFERFALYEPETFEKYVRMLGVNNDDHVVVYGRGVAAGMLFAARVYWTFKVYGFTNVSVLDGGLAAWKAAGGAVTSAQTHQKSGNFDAKPLDKHLLATFDDIPFKHLDQIEYFDARPKEQFNGDQPLDFPNYTGNGAHVAGAKSFPLTEVMTADGMKSQQDVDEAIKSHHLKPGADVVVACRSGVQASLLHLALARSGLRARVYNGSMTELVNRAPELIDSK